MNEGDLHVQCDHGEWVGLLAGSGRFPFAFADAAHRQGKRVYCVGVAGMVSEELADVCDGFETASIMCIGRAIRLFKRAGIDRAVMAGKIDKTVIFKKFRWLRNLPDLRMIRMAWRYYRERRTNTDDNMLLAVIREFGYDNIRFESALDYCPELLVKHGFLTRRKPSAAQWRDINFGWEMAKELGRLDIGQTVVVNDTAVIAVEAIEGTDAAILRAGQLCARGGFTVVKVAKPQQEYAFRRADRWCKNAAIDARSRRPGARDRSRNDDSPRRRGSPRPRRQTRHCDRVAEGGGTSAAIGGVA